jgi:long-chain acyl-CoA synthetase
MPPQVTQVWHIWGVDLREMYGLTECLAISIAQFVPFPRPGDIGRPTDLDGFEFKLTSDNEMMLRSPAVCQGYWQQPDKSAEVFEQDGWLRTGDIAELTPQGAIKLVDRKKEIMVTAGGKTLSPQQIEKALKGSPYFAEAVAIAEARRYVTALVMLDYTTVSEWARANKITYTSYTNLVTRPEVEALVEREVAKANEFLARAEQVKYVRIIPQELDPEEGETTPNYKIKRKLIAEMFGDLIESMYETKTRELFRRAVGA